jgi:hypothetical protein
MHGLNLQRDARLQVRWAHGEGKLKTKKMSEDKAWRMLQALTRVPASAIGLPPHLPSSFSTIVTMRT